jgi:hypothetical protein
MERANASDHPERFRFPADRDIGTRGAQEVEGELAQDGEVLGALVPAVAGAVLIEAGVEHPVQRVPDGPVGAHGTGERLGREGRAEET